MEDAAARLASDPRYIALVRKRGRFTIVLTVIMLIVYFGFVLTIAFDKALLARSVSGGAVRATRTDDRRHHPGASAVA